MTQLKNSLVKEIQQTTAFVPGACRLADYEAKPGSAEYARVYSRTLT